MLGEQAMKRMASSKVFLSGLGGVGVEIGNFNFNFFQFLLNVFYFFSRFILGRKIHLFLLILKIIF